MTKKTYLLIDAMNLMWRSAHVTRGDAYDRVGLALHIILNSLPYTARKFNIDHVVFAFEGRSWRRDIYPEYKANRKIAAAKDSEDKRIFKELMVETLGEFQEFLDEKTNCTVLKGKTLEADDLIAGWIRTHPDDDHVIVSTDSDFKQLIASNVTIYNGVDKQIINLEGYFDDKGKKIEKKGKVDPEFFLFEKIIRGDTSDNIKPAYYGARMSSTKHKTGILEAYKDRHKQGYPWQNFMFTTLTDVDGTRYKVEEKYKLNKLLIDLTAQPAEVMEEMAVTISEAYENAKSRRDIGFGFIKFCKKHELQNLALQSESIVRLLAKKLES